MISFTVTYYRFSRWGVFRGSSRVGLNAGRLAVRFSWRRVAQG